MTTPKTPFQKWYATNKETLNKARRERYAKDKKFKARVTQQNKESRTRTTKASETTGKLFRTVRGIEVEVFRISHVAEVIGRDEQSIRIWENQGYIPKPSIPGVHRVYMQYQIDLLAEFAQLMTEVRYTPSTRESMIAAKSAEIKAQWAGD